MSDRWCDDCAWPYECMAAHACRRAEQGERRVAATAETAAKIERTLPEVEMVAPDLQGLMSGCAEYSIRHGTASAAIRIEFDAPLVVPEQLP